MTDSTETESVPAEHVVAEAPPPPSAPPTGDRRRLWPWWAALGVVVALAAGVLAAFTVEVDYFEFRPGSARPTAALVSVDGTQVPTFPPASDIAFTTVSLRRSTLASYTLSWFDDDVEVVAESLILGDRSPEENRQFNLQLMDTSKQDAIRVALLRLGYEVPVSIDGMVVVQLIEDAAASGLLEMGDTIVAIQGEPIDDLEDVSRIMDGRRPGETVTLEVEPPTREGTRTVEVTLGAGPDDPERGLIGVSLEPRSPVYDFPFQIDIDSGNVGGPSAGLAFTLGVLDVLTPGELTGGLRVAVTGTIDGLGNVGQVGGVTQKVAAAIDDGYDVFVVPAPEAELARERAGDAIQIVAVGTLGDALDALADLGGSGLGDAVSTG